MRPIDPIKRLLGRPFDCDWRWPSRANPDDWDRVTFESAGATLTGIYGDADGPRRGAVLLSHPMDLRAKGYFLNHPHTDVLRDAGYEVFAFDYNGFGESEHGTARFPRDVAAALSCMDRTVQSDRYGALGVSFGAGNLLSGLARTDHDVRCAVFDAVYSRPVAFWKRYDWRTAVILRLWLAARPRVARALSPLENAADLTTPDAVQFVTGASDEYTPPEVAERVADAVGVPDDRVDAWTVPGAGHLDALREDRAGYEERIVGLFDDVVAES